MSTFQSTQIGRVMIGTFIVGIAIVFLSRFQRKRKHIKTYNFAHIFLGIILFVTLLLSYQLTITITDSKFIFRMGGGVVQQSYNLEDITECQVVRNKRWYGFGIRRIEGARLYNVSGLDAVQLSFTGDAFIPGLKLRVGSKEATCVCEELEKYFTAK